MSVVVACIDLKHPAPAVLLLDSPPALTPPLTRGPAFGAAQTAARLLTTAIVTSATVRPSCVYT